MRKGQVFGSYLAKDDVKDHPLVLTVADVRVETIKSESGEEEKPVMHFTEEDAKSWILNRTNWDTIEAAYGEESDSWRGKQVELYFDPGIRFGAKITGGVRVRIPSSNGATNGDDLLTLEQATTIAANAGISKEDLVVALKTLGLKGYNPRRDTATVRKLIDEAMDKDAAFGGDADELVDTSDIPF